MRAYVALVDRLAALIKVRAGAGGWFRRARIALIAWSSFLSLPEAGSGRATRGRASAPRRRRPGSRDRRAAGMSLQCGLAELEGDSERGRGAGEHVGLAEERDRALRGDRAAARDDQIVEAGRGPGAPKRDDERVEDPVGAAVFLRARRERRRHVARRLGHRRRRRSAEGCPSARTRRARARRRPRSLRLDRGLKRVARAARISSARSARAHARAALGAGARPPGSSRARALPRAAARRRCAASAAVAAVARGASAPARPEGRWVTTRPTMASDDRRDREERRPRPRLRPASSTDRAADPSTLFVDIRSEVDRSVRRRSRADRRARSRRCDGRRR